MSALVEEHGVVDIAHFTFICGIKSEMGTFLKMFGPTLGESKDASNVPITFAVATVKIRGHLLRPGGLMKESDGSYTDIKLIVVPFWISAIPFFTQTRLVKGYEGDWEARLAPVLFQLGSSAVKKGENLYSYKKPTLLRGWFFGMNH